MHIAFLLPALAPALLLAAAPARALTVSWGTWINAEGLYGAQIDTPGGTVSAVYSGAATGLISSCIASPDRWATGDYNGAANRPVCQAVVLSDGGAKALSFSAPLENPYLALMNWDGVTVLFDAPFDLVSYGSGYFGTGTPLVNGFSTGFTGDGPVHAILRFNGTFTSIGFTDTDSGRPRFLTVGAGPAAVVPEPASWAMLIAGFGVVGSALRRRARTAGQASSPARSPA